jgi:hypothetical protein
MCGKRGPLAQPPPRVITGTRIPGNRWCRPRKEDMTRPILTTACMAVAIGLSACGYEEQDYNAANADYNADEANYAGNEAGYANAADYNAGNAAYEGENMANAADNAANAVDNTVANNSY